MLVPCTMQGMRIRGIFSFLGKRISPFDPQEKGPTLQASSSKNFNACRLHCPQRGAAAFEAAIRFASASTTRCRSAHLAEVQPNFRLPPVSTMRRAPAMPHSVGSLSPDKRHSRLTIVRRGCKRSRLAGIHGAAMYTALTLRSACSHSSYKPAMSGGEGDSPRPFSRRFKGDTLCREREYPPLAHSRTVREQRAALPRCQFRFPYGKTISPEAKSCRGRREHENADAARSVPPARRCWTRRGNSQCPSPW